MIKMKSQQKSHSGLAPNVKEKIHHIHQSSSKPINPRWFSRSCGNKQTAAFRSGGGRKKHHISRGPRFFSYLLAEWHACCWKHPCYSMSTPRTLCTSFPKITLTFRSVLLVFISSFLFLMSYTQSITNECHKSGVSAVIISTSAHQAQSVEEFRFPIVQSLPGDTHLKTMVQ